VYRIDGTWVQTIAPEKGPRPADLTAALLSQAQARDPHVDPSNIGDQWRHDDPGQLRTPGSVFIDRDHTRAFVANAGLNRVEIFDLNPETGHLSRRPPAESYLPGHWRTFAVAGGGEDELFVVQSPFGGIRRYADRSDLTIESDWFADVPLGPYGKMQDVMDIAVAPNSGRVAVADRHHNRVVVYDEGFKLPAHPHVDNITATTTDIRYQTRDTVLGKVMLRESPYPRFTPARYVDGGFGQEKIRTISIAPSRTHAFTLEGLTPTTRYYYRLYMPELTQVPYNGWSMEYCINTLAPAGYMSFIQMRVKALLLPNVIRPDDLANSEVPQPPKMSQTDIERYYLDRFEEARRFYWVNTRMQYDLALDTFIDNAFYRTSEQRPDLPDWYNALPRLNASASFDRMLAKAGRENTLYYGKVICTAERQWNPVTHAWFYRGSGGGTLGIDWPRPATTTFLGGSDIAWLLVHEFKHQMESQFAHSGMDSEDDRNWFCHFSPAFDNPETPRVEWPWDTAADHGEHWDGVAWQLRHITQDQHRRNRWGTIATARDRDRDGVPDADPDLPLDEHRLRSNPLEADSDKDGVSDLHELLASTWVTAMNERVRDRISVPYIDPDPNEADSDDDGVPDGVDPYPIYPYDTEIPRATITVDGQRGDWTTAQRIAFSHTDLGPKQEDVNVSVLSAYDDTHLYYALHLQTEHPNIRVIVDADGDGFYWGNDNICLRIGPDGKLTRLRLHLCNRNRWPYFESNSEFLSAADVKIAQTRGEDGRFLEIALPKTPGAGLELNSGEKIGLMVYLQMPSEAWVSVFEPYKSFKSRLVGPETGSTASARATKEPLIPGKTP
jgi:hypothetical protein